MPLNDEQQCLMSFGEWEQYCSGVNEDIARTNSLLSWEYHVEGCSLRPFNPEQVLRSMIEDGGWSFIGDSLTRGVQTSLQQTKLTRSTCSRYIVNYIPI